LTQVIARLESAEDALSYLASCRIPGQKRLYVGDTLYELTRLMEERETTARRLFEQLMEYHSAGNVPESMRNAAHQLDIMVHGNVTS
jgi:hypothetical protein